MEKTEVHIEQVRRANEKWVKLWYKKARQIVLFRQKNKRWPDPESHNRQELALGLWKRKLRKYYKEEKLPEKLIQYLQGNDFYFAESERWKAKFHTLKNYVKEHGGLPAGSHPLREWVKSLYHSFGSLPPEKQKALKSISFMTLVTPKKNAGWEKQFACLKLFFEEHRKLPSRKKDKQLALWVGKERIKLKKGKMPAENIKRLKEAGINLLAGTFSKQPWEEVFYDLKKFIQKNETWPHYLSKQLQEKRLYGWLQNQRADYRKGKLTDDRIRLLKGINFVFK